jgi:hypothetical protein
MKIIPWLVAAFALLGAVYFVYLMSPAGQPQRPRKAEPDAKVPTIASADCPPCPRCPPPATEAPVHPSQALPLTSRDPASSAAPEAACVPEAPGACPPPTLQECLVLPGIQGLRDAAERAETWDDLADAAVRTERVRQARHATLDTLLQEDLALTPDQVRWLAEAACALRELRWFAVAHMHDDGVSATDVRELILAERDAILREIEAFLGAEAYGRFRAIGGIGLLNDTLECADVP